MRNFTLAIILIFGLAGTAFANVDVELAFSPDTAAPGDEISFFFSIANLGDEDAVAEVELFLAFMDYEFGPFPLQLPLAAGEELSREMVFMAPGLPMGGTLSITVSATIDGMTDTATASLTLTGQEGSSGYNGLVGLGEDLIFQMNGGEPTASVDQTLGGVKTLYR